MGRIERQTATVVYRSRRLTCVRCRVLEVASSDLSPVSCFRGYVTCVRCRLTCVRSRLTCVRFRVSDSEVVWLLTAFMYRRSPNLYPVTSFRGHLTCVRRRVLDVAFHVSALVTSPDLCPLAFCAARLTRAPSLVAENPSDVCPLSALMTSPNLCSLS